MSEVRGVVVAHGNLAQCLVETTRSISGVDGALSAISNEGRSPASLIASLEEAIGDGQVILFVDLASGSCAHTARLVSRGKPGVSVISGANLPMLLDFVFHRDLEVADLADRLVRKAQDGIVAHLSDSAT